MSQQLGMNPDEVRAKAQTLNAQLSALDGLAQQVSLSRLASLNPLSYGISPGSLVVAPASIGLLSGAVADVAAATQSARELAGKLGVEADQQVAVSSASDDSYERGQVPGVPPTTRPGTFDWWQGINSVWDVYDAVASVTTIARWTTAAGFLATSVRGAQTLSGLNSALGFSSAFRTLSTVEDFVGGGAGVFGRVVAGAGVLFSLVDTVEAAADGDVGGAIWGGAKTLLAAGVFIPGPVGIVCGVVSAGIAVGELIYDNWDHITDAAGAVGDFVGDAAGAVGDFVSDVWPW